MNKRVTFIFLLVMSVCTLWWIRSFFLVENISKRILSGDANKIDLLYANSVKLPALDIFQHNTQPIGSNLWLRATRELATHDDHFALALVRYFGSVKDENRRLFWLEQAIALGNEQASWLLAEFYWSKQQYLSAEKILAKFITQPNNNFYQSALVKLIELMMLKGDVGQLTTYITQLTAHTATDKLLTELRDFSVIKGSTKQQVELPENCIASIQMYASNLADLRRTSWLIAQTASSKLSDFVCFRAPRYIPLSELECLPLPQETIRCNEAIWQEHQHNISTRYLGVMVPAGGANVNHGIMYIDGLDSPSVFRHELLHLLGFVDEYPLPPQHAKCMTEQKKAFAHNVAVLTVRQKGDKEHIRQKVLKQLAWGHLIDDDTPIMTRDNDDWLLGTPVSYQEKIGLFSSNTCLGPRYTATTQQGALQAFKPLSQATSLGYQELEFPGEYFQLLMSAPEKFLMPSFHTNIMLAQAETD